MALKESDVEFVIEVEAERIPYVGNCSAIDEETDRENEEWIRSELARGNDLAWCSVIVRAIPRDAALAGFCGLDSLGGVSCANRRDLDALIDDHGMRAEALDDLNRQLESVRGALCPGEG